MLIGIGIPNDTNVTEKEEEKVMKYIPLAMEMKQLWNEETVTTIPIVTSATGITSSNFLKYIKTMTLNTSIHTNIQEAISLKTAAIIKIYKQIIIIRRI